MKEGVRGGPWTTAARVLAALAMIAYPLLVWRGLAHASPRAMALGLLCVLVPAVLIRLRSRPHGPLRGLAFLPLVTMGSLVLASLLDSLGFVLLVPVAVNATLLAVFGSSLRSGSTPVIERFARLQESSLEAAQLEWCRRWTVIWCLFFVANGSIAALLAWLAPLSWWAFYNGFLAYVLIGTLLVGEWALRIRRFPRGERR